MLVCSLFDMVLVGVGMRHNNVIDILLDCINIIGQWIFFCYLLVFYGGGLFMDFIDNSRLNHCHPCTQEVNIDICCTHSLADYFA